MDPVAHFSIALAASKLASPKAPPFWFWGRQPRCPSVPQSACRL